MSDLWTGSFGDEYVMRNSRIDVPARAHFWNEVIPDDVESILEVGANIGANLQALEMVTCCQLYACEPNALARSLLKKNMEFMPADHITADTADRLSFGDRSIDLVFTCGVLIHIPPHKLADSMKEIHRVAKRYIICAEYESKVEEIVPYRGQHDALWKRPYASAWLEAFPALDMVGRHVAGKDKGFDDLTVWVFRKP